MSIKTLALNLNQTMSELIRLHVVINADTKFQKNSPTSHCLIER